MRVRRPAVGATYLSLLTDRLNVPSRPLINLITWVPPLVGKRWVMHLRLSVLLITFLIRLMFCP